VADVALAPFLTELARLLGLVDIQVRYQPCFAPSGNDVSLVIGHGGFGFTSRMWWLTLDTIDPMNVVIADGAVSTESKTSDPGLFWVGSCPFIMNYFTLLHVVIAALFISLLSSFHSLYGNLMFIAGYTRCCIFVWIYDLDHRSTTCPVARTAAQAPESLLWLWHIHRLREGKRDTTQHLPCCY
jgi:hypothetical protein